MNFGVLSIAAGGFLLGGAYSMARLPNDNGSRGWAQIGVAVVFVLAAAYFIVTGILGLLAD